MTDTQAVRMVPDLLPCPFCGGKAEIERFGNTRVSTIYRCEDCACQLETGEEFNHGREWNRRAAAPSVQPGAVGWPVHVVLATGDYDEQKAAVRQSETYKRGDMVLAWVNEGDLYANPYVNLETLATLQPVAQKEEG